ncbi:hypothetical protein AB0O18_33840 [Streptomyces sp. NPDC093224]|uniref:hypothetical protein n=1 Tax=Streptomyces sp. NPDC093224 TaxID=3155198 RepID=UPI00343C826E
MEWQNGRYAMAGLAVLSTLKDRDWPPAKRAVDALLLLHLLAELHRVDHLVPGCQWHLLDTDGLLPPPVRELLQDLIRQNAPGTDQGVDVRPAS